MLDGLKIFRAAHWIATPAESLDGVRPKIFESDRTKLSRTRCVLLRRGVLIVDRGNVSDVYMAVLSTLHMKRVATLIN